MHTRYDNRRACVLGAGVSGLAAAKLLAARGGRVWLLDAAPRARLKRAEAALRGTGVELLADATMLPPEPFDLCVTSPGFAPAHPWLAACRARAIPVIAELDLGYACWRGGLLAVTGSKGKSSLVKLCAETLTAAGRPAAPCGNYGTPLSELALTRPDLAWAVVEASSFQLEWVVNFRPRIAVLLNIQADHLDRHASLEEYARIKLALFARQGAGDTAIVPAGSGHEARLPAGAAAVTFGAEEEADWRYTPGCLRGRQGGGACAIAMAGAWFDNPVFGLAAAAAGAGLTACGLDAREIADGLAAYVPLPHRMQEVALSGGVRFVDDSKATSLAATAAALRMTQGPVRLIAGGRLKERDLSAMKELLTDKVKKVYLIGESAHSLREAWATAAACEICGEIKLAVHAAAREAVAGETVLLAPGCASFDQFESYNERGACFTRLAREIVKATAGAVRCGGQEKSE